MTEKEQSAVEKEAVVGPEEGLHARPASLFVKEAKKYAAEITVTKEDREANAKSSMSVMTFGAKKGETVVIRAEGDGAEEAVYALAELILSESP